MSIAEKIELICIPLFGLVLWVAAPALPGEIGVGNLLIWSAVILLLQSLVRDLWLLSLANRKPGTEPGYSSLCICVESVIGVFGIFSGVMVMIFNGWEPVEMTRSCWSLVVMIIMGTGYFLKDLILEMNPVRVRRDKNHMNTVVRWKRK